MQAHQLEVHYDGGDRFEIDVRGHRVTVDQPREDGGDDAGPTPTELFVASLASCMAFFAQRFLRRNGVDVTGFRLDVRYEMSGERPHRVSRVDVEVVLPAGVPQRLCDPLRRTMAGCTVDNTLRNPPKVVVGLLGGACDGAASAPDSR